MQTKYNGRVFRQNFFEVDRVSEKLRKCLHQWAKVDQASGPLPPKSLSILVDLTLKLHSLCIIVNVVENIWTFWFIFRIFCVASLERFILLGIGRNVKI